MHTHNISHNVGARLVLLVSSHHHKLHIVHTLLEPQHEVDVVAAQLVGNIVSIEDIWDVVIQEILCGLLRT